MTVVETKGSEEFKQASALCVGRIILLELVEQ